MARLRTFLFLLAAGAALLSSGCDECALDAERFCSCSDGRTGTRFASRRHVRSATADRSSAAGVRDSRDFGESTCPVDC
jgi:hypothetical protein